MSNICFLGHTGEVIVRNYLSRSGYSIVDNLDRYDDKKDFIAILDGVQYTVEVKTEQPYVKKNCFSFASNQLIKCTNVDMLYIVSVPPLVNRDYRYGGKLYSATPKLYPFKYTKYTTSYGKDMIGIPIQQPAITLECHLGYDEIEALNKHAYSSYG